jgi:hypothetical protein
MTPRWRTIAILASALVLLPGSAALALGGSDGEKVSGSLVEQVTRAAVRSLGAAAPVAILRAEDRGYDVLQVTEAMLEERLADDGTITDEDGTVVAPFRDPSGLIEGDPPGSGEEIGVALLESAIDKTTAKLDKLVDLERRAERAGVPDESLFTGLAAIGLLADGYSPEQIIVDGLIERGIALKNPVDGPVIVDERGKVLRPAGIEESPEQQESAAAIDSFVADVVDLIGGVDPTTAATTPFDAKFQVAIEIEITDVDGASYTIVGDGKLGVPDDKGLRSFVVGRGAGDLVGAGACSVGGGEEHPFEIEGNINLGLSGPATDGIGNVRVAVIEANLGVVGDDSLCVDIVRETTSIFELITYGPVEVRLRDGATGSAVSPFADATAKTTLKLST